MILIKICGITTCEDAVAAAEAGADAAGLNFYEKSPRYISEDRAAEIVQALPAHVHPVGVFVTQPPSEVISIAERVGVRTLQTYRDTPPPADVRFASLPAFRVRGLEDLDHVRRYVAAAVAAGSPPTAVLVDSFVAGAMGGTGHKAPWDLLADFDAGVPLILAGGLTPDNVAEAIRRVRPAGVDVAGGVESAPGRKDHGRIRAFIQAVRTCNNGGSLHALSG